MSDLFDAFKNYQIPVKKHFVLVEGRSIEVSLEKKLEIQKNGEKNYVLQGNVPVLKKNKRQQRSFAEIEQFVTDPFWPEKKIVWKK